MADKDIKKIDATSSGFGGIYSISTTSGVGGTIEGSDIVKGARISHHEMTGYENAVYTFLQAIRALDRETVSNREIAEALSLHISVVEAAMGNLQDRGVEAI